MKLAFIFAGQGSQFVGMGKDFYDTVPYAKEVYDKFPEIRELCFNDSDNKLNETAYAQKAMLLTSYVIANVLKNEGINPEYVCGLSLGEYSALAFANAWSLEDAVSIITFRGNLMQNALPLGTTKMAAVLGLDRDVILEAIKDVNGICEIANYNCPGQIVITGDNNGVDEAMIILASAGAKRCIPLNVSGAFHSSLLNDASVKLYEELNKYAINAINYKVVYNVSGKETTENLTEILKKQICNSVYFEDSIKYMIEAGVDTFVEIGPGKTLSGFVKKINRDVKVLNASDISGLNTILEELK